VTSALKVFSRNVLCKSTFYFTYTLLDLEHVDQDTVVGHAQANYNRSIVRLVTSHANTCAVAVSGHEVELATSCGLSGDRIVFNGNGKQTWELSVAVRLGCLVNVDSLFDARRLLGVCRSLATDVCDINTTAARILLRLNPAVNPVSQLRAPIINQKLRKSDFYRCCSRCFILFCIIGKLKGQLFVVVVVCSFVCFVCHGCIVAKRCKIGPIGIDH